MLQIPHWEFWEYVDGLQAARVMDQVRMFEAIAVTNGGAGAKRIAEKWDKALKPKTEALPADPKERKQQGLKKMAAMSKLMGGK